MNKTLDYYMSLPYTMEITPDTDDGGWVIEIKELEGCLTQADAWDDILPMIREAMELWVSVSLDHGHPVPEPEKMVG